MRREGWFTRLFSMGAAAQATMPGLYAWGVTVLPGALAHGASGMAKLAATVALAALLASPLCADRLGGLPRIPLLWAFVFASALTWSTAPAALAPSHIDASRAFAGMLGWALFAMTWSAPALQGRLGEGRILQGDALAGDATLARLDAAYVLGSVALAAILQTSGWAAPSVERALLVRFVGLTAGLAVMAATTEVALARRATRIAVSPRRRLRRSIAALFLLGTLLSAGLLFGLRD